MVRRVGFGNSPKPSHGSKTSTGAVQSSTRSEPIPNARKSDVKEETLEIPTPLNATYIFSKVVKIVAVIVIATKITNDHIFMILFAWAGLEIYKLVKTIKASLRAHNGATH